MLNGDLVILNTGIKTTDDIVAMSSLYWDFSGFFRSEKNWSKIPLAQSSISMITFIISNNKKIKF